jgi:hypothetical protein
MFTTNKRARKRKKLRAKHETITNKPTRVDARKQNFILFFIPFHVAVD